MAVYRPDRLNDCPDLFGEFQASEALHFPATKATAYDADTGEGTVLCTRMRRKNRMAFNQVTSQFEAAPKWEFPPDYPEHYELPFRLDFVSPRTVRLRLWTRPGLPARTPAEEESLMLDGPVPASDAWTREEDGEEGVVAYRSEGGRVVVRTDPWRIEFYDRAGRLLTKTFNAADRRGLGNGNPIPFTVLRRPEDLGRRIAAAFCQAPGERFYGCGEHFGPLDKRGTRVDLWTTGTHNGRTDQMYKPVPMVLSSRGYGAFVHTSAPCVFDFGSVYDGAGAFYVGEETLDVFYFLGSPEEILSEYTALTGRSPLPPLWTFGLWMSRITYGSADEVRALASTLREKRVPCDVINIDVGWFEEGWKCDFLFSTTRFPEPAKLLAELEAQGLRVCLWQITYFPPGNPFFHELVEKGYAIGATEAALPTEDAILDFSHPEAVRWYQAKLAALFELGVKAIKVDFGEAAPVHGLYHSGRSGWTEHNLYPLRYNKAVADITREKTGAAFVWARSAWAGSQRYPTHWGGDIECTDIGMAATLRAGLSFGLCGFSYWSHDIGGFVGVSPEALYRRWLPFGLFGSHPRCHGSPPTEPWEYTESFLDAFREATEMRYRLLPYVYAQAAESSARGWPMMRPLFFHYPDDPLAQGVDDAYLFGRDLLVAPLLEEERARDVVLPAGGPWTDYQTGAVYEGGRAHRIEAGAVPVIVLVRAGAAVPHAELAQHTDAIDFTKLELRVFTPEGGGAEGLLCLPGQTEAQAVRVGSDGTVTDDPAAGRVAWTVRQ